jgi:hypothetical protein
MSFFGGSGDATSVLSGKAISTVGFAYVHVLSKSP